MRRQMPVVAGQVAVSHFKSNFRQGGFVNDGLRKWEKPKRIGKWKNYSMTFKNASQTTFRIKPDRRGLRTVGSNRNERRYLSGYISLRINFHSGS